MRNGSVYPKTFSFSLSWASEISRQYLLLLTVLLQEKKSLGAPAVPERLSCFIQWMKWTQKGHPEFYNLLYFITSKNASIYVVA